MRSGGIIFAAALTVALGSAVAQTAGKPAATPAKPAAAPVYSTFYTGPTKVNLAGRPVVADISLSADMAAAKKGDLKVNLTTDVTKFVDQTEKDLKDYIATRWEKCGERWSSGEPVIQFPNNAIRFQMAVTVEYWQCGIDGKGKPGRMTRDSGSVDVTLIPFVDQGKLQAKLGPLDIKVTQGMGKYMPLEFVTKRAIEGELKKLNANPKFYRAPNPLYAEGFRYDGIGARVTKEQRVIITARYRAIGKEDAFPRLASKMASQGITQ
jgi:hypothetical protein